MKILLAVDGSKYSEAAVQALISKIRKEDTDVLVLQVVEPRIFSTPPQMAPGYEPELEEIMKEQFQNAQQTVDRSAAALKAAGFNARGRVIEAETRSGILDLASEWHANRPGIPRPKRTSEIHAGERRGIRSARSVLFGIDRSRGLGNAKPLRAHVVFIPKSSI